MGKKEKIRVINNILLGRDSINNVKKKYLASLDEVIEWKKIFNEERKRKTL